MLRSVPVCRRLSLTLHRESEDLVQNGNIGVTGSSRAAEEEKFSAQYHSFCIVYAFFKCFFLVIKMGT